MKMEGGEVEEEIRKNCNAALDDVHSHETSDLWITCEIDHACFSLTLCNGVLVIIIRWKLSRAPESWRRGWTY